MFKMHILRIVTIMLASRTLAFSAETYFGVISELQKHFKTTCLVFILNDNQGTFEYLHVVKKFIIRESVSSLYFHQLDEMAVKHQCQGRYPLFIILQADNSSQDSLAQLSTKLTLSSSRWLLFFDEPLYKNNFASLRIPLDCEFFVVHRGSGSGVTLTELYHEPLQTSEVAQWSADIGLKWTTPSLYQSRNFYGAVLKAAKLFWIRDLPNRTNDNEVQIAMDSYTVRLWKILEKNLNFTTRYFKPHDGLYGHISADNSIDGILKMVNSTQVDVSLESFDINRKLVDVIEFLPSIWTSELATYIKHPAKLQSKPDLLLAPFSSLLWWCIVASLMILTLALSVICYATSTYSKQNLNKFSLQTSWFNIFSSFCQQGYENTPQNLSGQLVVMTSLVIALIIYDSYSAVIISFLSVAKPHLPFTTFQGLLDGKTYQFQIPDKSTMFTLFQKATDPLLSRVFSELIKPHLNKLPTSTEEGLRHLCNSDNIALMTHRVQFERLLPNTTCDIIRVPTITLTTQASLIMSQRSPYYKFLKLKIHDLIRFGIINLEKARYFTYRKIINAPVTPDITSISLPAFSLTLATIAVGIFGSIVFLLLEIFVNRLYRAKRAVLHV